jgi:hypothetical protein
VLVPWPGSEKAHHYVTGRLAPDAAPPPGATWRAALDREARVVVEGGAGNERERAIAVLVGLGGESIAWLDARALATWSDLGAEEPARAEARGHLAGRLRFTRQPIGAEPPAEALNTTLVDASRRVIEARRPSLHRDLRYERRAGVWITGVTSNEEFFAADFDLDLALRAIEARGTDADRAWEDELVLAEWPATDWTSFDDALIRRIEAHPDDDALRTAVTERAARGIRDDPDVRGIVRVLFAYQRPDTDDQALRGLLAHFDTEHWFMMHDHLDRASPAFERDAVAEARRIVDAAQPFEHALERDRYRAAHAIELIVALEGDTADCAELRELDALRGRTGAHGNVTLPSRCTTPPPPPTPTPAGGMASSPSASMSSASSSSDWD